MVVLALDCIVLYCLLVFFLWHAANNTRLGRGDDAPWDSLDRPFCGRRPSPDLVRAGGLRTTPLTTGCCLASSLFPSGSSPSSLFRGNPDPDRRGCLLRNPPRARPSASLPSSVCGGDRAKFLVASRMAPSMSLDLWRRAEFRLSAASR
ncbi:unnamed protein product [Pseudo-nitzschia multistriata]|uniref:Uncharacterized protein n=1 Tax=Pseudo-nitzschia multistriata TaxID=183589 RepID=A0A448ZTC9_9STRA|nr:unnamed protein product [Pseudo-nitzschia multistriata]